MRAGRRPLRRRHRDHLLGEGFCARWDGEEINIKTANTSSENYDVLRADGYMRRAKGRTE